MKTETRTDDEIGEWLHIEEMKYARIYNKDELIGQSVHAIAFVLHKTPKEVWDIYTNYRQSAKGI